MTASAQKLRADGSATPWWLRPGVADLAVPVLLQIPAAATLAARHEDRWWVWLVAEALLAPLPWRRRSPERVYAATCLIALVQWFAGVALFADAALLVGLYTLASQRDRREWLPATAVLQAGVVLASVRFAPAGDGVLGSLVFLTGLVAAALFLGTSVRARRQYLQSLEERARRLEVERDQRAQLAVTAERTRIAREMHDVVAHSLSVVTTLADAAVAISSTDPEGATAAMRQVAATGRAAQGEMRRLLGVLREPGPARLSPQPTLPMLDSLLDEVRRLGLPVRLVVTGQLADVPETAQATVYRIVQEALTNVLKHSRDPAIVRVQLDCTDGHLAIDVADDGSPPAGAAAPDGGHGLRGIRERVALFGGEFSAGPARTGGWLVHALLPLGGPA